MLEVEGSYGGFRDIPRLREPARYSLDREGRGEALEAVQWADCDAGGRLLVATTDGRLQVREPIEAREPVVVQEHEVASLRPQPEEAPAGRSIGRATRPHLPFTVPPAIIAPHIDSPPPDLDPSPPG